MLKKGEYDYLVKTLIVGDSGVGKTCLLLRYCEDNFTLKHIVTIGIDFKFKDLDVNGKKVRLQIWDTAGQEKFRTITETYYRGAAAIILAYSAADRNSFANAEKWLQQILNHSDEHVIKVLVSTKNDIQELAVESSEGRKLAEKYKLKFFETSAKDNQGINECFNHISEEVLPRIQQKEISTPKNSQQNKITELKNDFNSNNNQHKKNQNCC